MPTPAGAEPDRARTRPAASGPPRGRRSRPRNGSPSAIAPEETTRPARRRATIAAISRARRPSTLRRTLPPGPATRLVPSLTTTVTCESPLLGAVAHDAVLAQPEVAVRDGPARPGRPVDVDPRLRRARQLVAVGEARRRVPERGRPAVASRKRSAASASSATIPAASPEVSLVRDPHGLVEAVDERRSSRSRPARRRSPTRSRAAGRAAAHPRRSPRTSRCFPANSSSSAGTTPSAPRSTSTRLSRLQTPRRSRLASASASAFAGSADAWT